MVSWRDSCPHCGKPLPDRGNRRVRVPSRRGRRLLVHAHCANELERQGELDLDAASTRPRPLEPDQEIPF